MAPKRACDVCYKRKIQCLITNPDDPCEWCSHHGLDCTFNRGTQKKPNNIPALVNDVQELFRRVQNLESTLSRTDSPHQSSSGVTFGSLASTPLPDQNDLVPDITPPSLSPKSIPRTQPSSVLSPKAQFQSDHSVRSLISVSHYLGQNWYHKGIPILSERGRQWLLWRTGQHVSLEKFRLFGSTSNPHPWTLTQHPMQEICRLPDRHVVESILDIYFGSSFRLFYPILDRILAEETLTTAYERCTDTPLTSSELSATACVLATLSLVSRFKGSEHIQGTVSSGEYAEQAQCLVGYISGEATLDVLQAVLMLQVYRASTGEWETATSLHAIACRIVCGLGGHFHQPEKLYDPSISQAERQSRHIRTLFWLSYVFDKDISLRSGQPPLLVEDYCDLTLPENYTGRYDPLVSPDHDIVNDSITYEGLVPFLPGDIGLSHVKEKACLLLYSPKTFGFDDCQLLLHIRHLDNELENWRSSIPSEYRPRLTIQPGFPYFLPEMSMPQRMRHISLQLEYHYLMTAIHTAVRRCGKAYAEVTDLPEDLHSVFHSSSDLSLEASRSTLLLLKSYLKELEDGRFWLVAFYPPVAAMSLFMNILLHPLDSQVKSDLEILASSVSTFQDLSVESLSGNEIECVQELNNFVVELVRLGNCAIWKARREARQEVL